VTLNEGAGRQLLHADLAATDARAKIAGLERVRLRMDELLVGVDGRQPVAELVGEVVAGAASAVALDERRGAEVFQTRSGTGQRLAAAVRAGARVLHINQSLEQWTRISTARPPGQLHERHLNLSDTWDHFASRITSPLTSFRMRFTHKMRNKTSLNTIQFVKRIQNDVQDDVMRNAK